jgi:CheY-like chemotaxis protein/HPt (histidine-containing phosphotransfer) domain-containing protein
LQGRILVADDNSTNRLVAVGILKNLGLRADAVDDGVEALAALRSAEYDVVLMDLVMPEMDGFVTTREIRCGGNGVLNPAIPIIAMTAQAMVGDRERCLEAGMNAYVSKPVSAKALSDILAKLLEPATMPRPIRPTPPVDGPIWDKAGMMERLDDTALARVVMEGYLNDIPRQIEALRTFVTERRPAEAACQAHAIKGASGNVGGQVVRKLAAEIEKSCNEGNLRLASQIAELETEFGKLKDAMKSIPV